MPPSPERTPRERETLLFSDTESAQSFSEQVENRLRTEQTPGVRREKDIVAEEVAKEFEAQGAHVDKVLHPWEHTPAEHEEAQQLVDIAFQVDLPTALKKAKESEHYPRILDLFHDLLTNEMYDIMRQSQLHKQPVALWLTEIFVIILVALAALVLLFMFT